MRRMIAVFVAALLLTACGGGDGSGQRQPVGTSDGFRATGLLDGARVAISRGAPIVVDGDCDPNEGLDEDLCIIVRTIDGLEMNIKVENPGALVPGRRLEVDERACGDDFCDSIRDVAVVVLRIDGVERQAVAGNLDVGQAGQRYAAEFDLLFAGGDRLTGDFDVAPPGIPPVIGPDGGVGSEDG